MLMDQNTRSKIIRIGRQAGISLGRRSSDRNELSSELLHTLHWNCLRASDTIMSNRLALVRFSVAKGTLKVYYLEGLYFLLSAGKRKNSEERRKPLSTVGRVRYSVDTASKVRTVGTSARSRPHTVQVVDRGPWTDGVSLPVQYVRAVQYQ
jgi:hypothetical protein